MDFRETILQFSHNGSQVSESRLQHVSHSTYTGLR